MTKRATLLLIVVLTVSSLIVVKAMPALAAPFVPEFTLKFEAHPYDVPTTYGIDPYTGKNVTIEEGYHARNETIIFTIKNQPITNLFYNIRYTGHFDESWTELYSYSYAYPESLGNSPGNLIPQSNSGYTVKTIPAEYPFANGATIDFQVQALSWVYVDVWVLDHPMAPPPIGEIGHYEQRFIPGETSGWSNSQTMTFPAILPNVTLLLPQDGKFNTSDVPLDFAVDQPISQFKYSLDGQENVTVTGNTTLTGLANGYHNVTVYAMDESGNTGASETLFFRVEAPEPFPVLTVAAASVAAVAVLGAGLLVYFRKHKHQPPATSSPNPHIGPAE
jgi:hypothetical protein